MVIIISEEQVLELLDWDTTFQAVKVAMESVAQQKTDQKPRSFTKFMDEANSLLLTMPGCLQHPKFGAIACKLVTMNPENAYRNPILPTINANIALFDEETGVLKAIIAGTEITKWRTAAASAVATHLLAPRGRILAILGAGTQGKIHALAFQHFFNFEQIRIWNHNPSKAFDLVQELNSNSPKPIFKHCETNESCVRGADVIITATFSPHPIVQLNWLNDVDTVHINAVGAGLTHHSELEEAIYKKGDVYVDHLAGAAVELKGLVEIGVKFKGEIGGNLRKEKNRITVFQSLGMAVEDCAMARLIYDRYMAAKN